MTEDLDFSAEAREPDFTNKTIKVLDVVVANPRIGSELKIINPIAKQWAEVSRGIFSPAEKTIDRLPSGVYGAGWDQSSNLLFILRKIITDELVSLPDTPAERVLQSIDVFWGSKARFLDKRQVFKRGILLWGDAGGGKTALIMQMTNDLIKRDGIVFYVDSPIVATQLLETFRRVEPDRHLICILEDLDEMVVKYGEHAILSLLDGETQIDSCVFIATTNYPEKLAKRIIRRPSRFDEVIKVGMPSDSARRAYLRSKMAEEELSSTELDKWVLDTKDMSIAHLKELMVCVQCLGRNYEETVTRLRSTEKVLSSYDDRQRLGF